MAKNPTSERALDPGEFNRYIGSVERMVDAPSAFVNSRSVTLIIAWTGMHPHVLVHPYSSGLRLREDGHISWIRPKNTKPIGIPAWPGGDVFGEFRPGIRDWAAAFIAGLPRERCNMAVSKRHGGRLSGTPGEDRPYCFCYRRVERAVERVSERVGMRDVTPRTLRHTFGAIVYVASGGDLLLPADWLGCSLETARKYVRQDWAGFGRRFATGSLGEVASWTPRPAAPAPSRPIPDPT